MNRPIRVRSLAPVSAEALARLEPGVFEVGPGVADPDALLVRSANLWGVEMPPSVLAVCRAGTGVDTIPVDDLARKGIPVFIAPGSNANAVKELVVAAVIIALRRIGPAWRFAQGLAGDDAAISAAVEEGKRRFQGREARGSTVAVIGLGAIGVEVANALDALGCRVVGYDPSPSAEHAARLGAGVRRAASLDDAVGGADVLTVHVPLDAATRGLVSAGLIEAMAAGAAVLNFARREIVDEAAVIAALDAGRLAAYVTDFPSATVVGHPGSVAMPHLGASTTEAQEAAMAMVLETLRRYVVEGTVRHAVNFPEVAAPRWDGARLCVVTSGPTGGVAPSLADAGVGVAGIAEASGESVGYVLVDLRGNPEPAAEAVGTLGEVVAVRVISRG